MLIIATKDMSAGNGEVGEMWQETKIFSSKDSLEAVMLWVGARKKRVVLTVPENDDEEFEAQRRL